MHPGPPTKDTELVLDPDEPGPTFFDQVRRAQVVVQIFLADRASYGIRIVIGLSGVVHCVKIDHERWEAIPQRLKHVRGVRRKAAKARERVSYERDTRH